jgi:RNA polymerase sigma-70 factor (ECF subfamily)
MNAHEDETRLVEAAKQGDEHAIAALYRKHADNVYRYIQSRVNNRPLAEDMTSDVFVRAIEKLPAYEQRGIPFLGWLYHLAHGLVVDYYRKQSRRQPAQSIDDMTIASDHNPEQAAFKNIRHEQLLHHIRKLTPEQQQVVSLRFLQGYDLRETAALMGKQIGAVKALQLRALRSLAKHLEPTQGADE